MRLRSSAIVFLIVFLISACGSAPPTVVGPTASPSVPAFGWETKPGSILFRIDRSINGESAIDAMNRLPLCTLYGDGYLQWINPVPPIGDEVFEARVNEATIRSFLDLIIRSQRFYSIPDYASKQLPPTGKFATDSITLRLNGETRTVRSYSLWAQNEFGTLLDKCTHISAEPVTYLPTGAWMTVQPIAGSQDPEITWAESTGFTLESVATSGKPMWISGNVLTFIWNSLHRSAGIVQWTENNKAYKIGLQIPNVTRESPGAPAVTPTMPVFVPSPYPTMIPTPTSRGIQGGPITETPKP